MSLWVRPHVRLIHHEIVRLTNTDNADFFQQIGLPEPFQANVIV